MLREISKITGLPYDMSNIDAMNMLRRIELEMPPSGYSPNIDDSRFVKMVKAAKDIVDTQGSNIPFDTRVCLFCSTDPSVTSRVDVYANRGKGVSRGKRSSVVSPITGIRYAYGPVWNNSVIHGTSIAINVKNRAKLECQALTYGITEFENLTSEQLCTALKPFLEKESS